MCAATLGGDIRHPEVRIDAPADAAAPEAPEQFVASKISDVMVNSPWVWPASETVHFLGLSLSFGVLLALNLRILGVMKQVPFAEVHRLLPWGMLGFALNTVSGFMFFAAQADQYTRNYVIYTKMAFVVLGGLNTLYFTFDRTWMLEPGGVAAELTVPAMPPIESPMLPPRNMPPASEL